MSTEYLYGVKWVQMDKLCVPQAEKSTKMWSESDLHGIIPFVKYARKYS